MSPLSTIICVNAARSAIQVIEVVFNRTGNPTHRNMGMVFAAALVLMMNILGLKRSGRATNANVEKDLALVGKSIEMLRALRYEMHISETLADVLTNLVSGITDSPQRAGANAQEGGQATPREDRERASSHERRTEGSDPVALPVHLPPDLDFTLPVNLSSLFRSDVFEQGFAIPVDDPVLRNATEEGLPPPAYATEEDIGSISRHLPPHDTTVDNPLGARDSGMSDLFMPMDDTLAMWPSMSPIFGWDEWGEHFPEADSTGT